MNNYPDVLLAVAGAHLRGQPLNSELTSRGAAFVEATRTMPVYRMFALDTDPPKPGVVRTAEEGTALEVEVWRLSAEAFGNFVAALPAPMAIGKVELAGGRTVSGFLVEPVALESARDISSFGGWKGYLAVPAAGP